jgi:hypothetical protein
MTFLRTMKELKSLGKLSPLNVENSVPIEQT